MKKIFVAIITILLMVTKVNATCVDSLNVKGVTYRTNGHQNQCLTGYMGGYTTATTKAGTVDSSCFTIGSSSIVKVRLNGTQFCFSPQAHGTASIKISVAARCTCSGQAISKTVSFKLSEWGLKSLSITGYDISPKFYNGTFKYTATVPNKVTSVEVNATANDKNSKIKVTGNDNLQVGENKITINVVTPQGDSRNYYITVTRSTGNDVPGSSTGTDDNAGANSSTKPSSSSKSSSKVTNTPSNNDNPETGLSYMYFVFGIGLASVFYLAWYTKKMNLNS